MASALQQALTNIRNFGGFSPRNIKKQISAIPRWGETTLINMLDRALVKARPGLTPDQPRPKRGKRISVKAIQPSPTTKVTTKLPAGNLTDQPTIEEITRAIEMGSKGSPIATMSAQIAQQQAKYPIFKKFPFLTVGQSHLESRGLKDFREQPELVNKPKQALGWGVFVPEYNPSTVEQVVGDFISAIGGREGDQFTPTQLRTSQVYQPFRENEDLNWYAGKYAGPVSERNPQAGSIYATNLASIMNKYAEVLDKIMKQRGAGFSTRY